MNVGIERSHSQSHAAGADVERPAPLVVILESIVGVGLEVAGHVSSFRG